MTEPRICAYPPCPVEFEPTKPHERFHAEDCRQAEWDRQPNRFDPHDELWNRRFENRERYTADDIEEDDFLVDYEPMVEAAAQTYAKFGTREQLIHWLAEEVYEEWPTIEIARAIANLTMAPLCVEPPPPAPPEPRVSPPPRASVLGGPSLPYDEWRAENAYLLNDPCSYCSSPSVALDHITPRWLGGPNTWENTTPACRSCNSSKGKWPLLIWLARRPDPAARQRARLLERGSA